MSSFETLQIFIFLVPGFFSSLILESIIIRKEKNKFNLIIEALIFSVLIYATMAIFKQENPITYNKDLTITFHWLSFLLMFIFSTFYGVFFGFLIHKDYFLKFFRWIKMTEKDSNNSVWNGVLNNHNDWITIKFDNGSRLCGIIKHYSEYPENPYLYLERPAWVKENKKTKKQEYINLDVKGILITPNQKIEYIYFF